MTVVAYLYTITHPSDPWRAYIGKTLEPGKREWRHHRSALKSTAPLYVWWRSLPSDPDLDVIEMRKFETRDDADAWAYTRETELIASARADGLMLLNANDGGLGGSNPTDEVREKIAASKRGRKLSLETRKKISDAQRGRQLSPSHIENMRRPKHSLEARKKIGSAQLGRKHSPETIKKRSDAQRGRKHSPETREKIGAAQRGRKLSQEHIANASAAHRQPGAGVRLAHGKWLARINLNGRRIHLGTFSTEEEARAARSKAERLYWGDSQVAR